MHTCPFLFSSFFSSFPPAAEVVPLLLACTSYTPAALTRALSITASVAVAHQISLQQNKTGSMPTVPNPSPQPMHVTPLACCSHYDSHTYVSRSVTSPTLAPALLRPVASSSLHARQAVHMQPAAVCAGPTHLPRMPLLDLPLALHPCIAHLPFFLPPFDASMAYAPL